MEKPSSLRASSALVWLSAVLLFWLILPAEGAGPFTVNFTGDTHALSPASSPNDGSGNVSLRSAIEAATAQSGPTTINVPGGTFNLSLGELAIAPNGGNTITINGAGSSQTIVSQTDGINRVFNIDANSAGGTSVTISGLTISGGHDQSDRLGGAAILAGSVTSVAMDSMVVQGCAITGNHCGAPNSAYTSQPGGGIQMAGGNLTVSSCTFNGNSSAASQGGAIAFIAPSLINGGSSGSLTILSSSFINNSMTNGSGSGPDGGGAVYIDSTAPAVLSIRDSIFQGNYAVGNQGATFGGAVFLNIGALNVDRCSFTGNSATGQGALGGAIYVDSGTLVVSYSRITGNSATNGGSGIYNHGINSATTIATNNWWGCNAGPLGAGCDQAVSDGGTLNVSPWIVLSGYASPNTILPNQSSALTVTFAQNSIGDSLSPGSLSALAGAPITFDTAVLGTISGAQLSIQPDGTANATFVAGASSGAGHANATVDNAVYTFSIAIISITLTSSGPVIHFEGGSSKVYVVQWAGAVDGPWTDFSDGTLVADSAGAIIYTDSSSPAPPTRFYRLRPGP